MSVTQQASCFIVRCLQVCKDGVVVAAIFAMAISGDTKYLGEKEVSWPALCGLIGSYPRTGSTAFYAVVR